MQTEKPKNKRRWSVRVLETLIVIAGVMLTLQLFLPDSSSTHSILEEAEPVVAIPIASNPNPSMDAQALFNEAEMLQQAGEYEEALVLTNLAIELSASPDMDYLWMQAWLLGEVEQHRAGVEAYHALYDMVPTNQHGSVYAGLCFNYGSLSDFDKATEYCERVGDYSSHTQFSNDSLCYIHGFTGQYELAVEECTSWIENSNAYLAYGYNNRSRAYLMLGEYEQTILDATQAIWLDTDHPEMPYTNRGLAKIALGQYEAGYADLMVAYGADDTYPDIYLGLALYHDYMGNEFDAKGNYCRYLDTAWVAPDNRVVQRANALGGCR